MAESRQEKPDFDEAAAGYPEELRPLAKRVLKKRWDNHKRVGRLEQQGTSLDLSIARLEFTLQQLVCQGILTQEQLLDMAWEWEENMALQLAQIEDTVDMRRKEAEAEFRRQMAEAQRAEQQRLATPAAGIMLPNGRVHLPQPDKEKQDE
jgi:hypothetical protein